MNSEMRDILWLATRSLIFCQLIDKNKSPMSDSEFTQKKDEAGRLTAHLMNYVPEEIKKDVKRHD